MASLATSNMYAATIWATCGRSNEHHAIGISCWATERDNQGCCKYGPAQAGTTGRDSWLALLAGSAPCVLDYDSTAQPAAAGPPAHLLGLQLRDVVPPWREAAEVGLGGAVAPAGGLLEELWVLRPIDAQYGRRQGVQLAQPAAAAAAEPGQGKGVRRGGGGAAGQGAGAGTSGAPPSCLRRYMHLPPPAH